MKLIDNFYNNLAVEIDKTYFPKLNHNNYDRQSHFAIELYSNGRLTYSKLISRLAKSCKETKEAIHLIVSKYVVDFEGYVYKPRKSTYYYLPLDGFNQPNGHVVKIKLTEAEYAQYKKNYVYIYDKEIDADRRAQD